MDTKKKFTEDVPYLTIESISLTRMKNGELYSFMQRLLDTMPLSDDEREQNLGCGALYVSDLLRRGLIKDLAKLQKLMKHTRSDSNTPILNELNGQRERLMSYIVNRMENARNAPTEAERQAGEALQDVAKKYAGFSRVSDGERTAVVDGMLHELEDSDLEVFLNNLQLKASLAQLDKVNGKYEYFARMREQIRMERRTSEKIRDVREAIILKYIEITHRAFATNLLNGNKEAEQYIKLLNTRIRDYKEKMAKRGKRV